MRNEGKLRACVVRRSPDCFALDVGERSIDVFRSDSRGWSWAEDLGPFTPTLFADRFFATAWGAAADARNHEAPER